MASAGGRAGGPRVRRGAVLAAVAAVVALGAATAVAVGGRGPGGCAAIDDEAGYTFSKQFTVPYAENQQGLAHADGLHYVGFDVGGGKGRIVAYDAAGAEVERTPPLPLGHTAELSHRRADGNLYVAIAVDGAGLQVGVVDMRATPPRLVRTYDFSRYGDSGMVAIDNRRDVMVVKSGPRQGPHTFTTADMDGKVLHEFTDDSQGTGQGLEVVGDCLLLYTSAPDLSSNTITVYDREGTRLSSVRVPVADEGEGLSVDEDTGRVYLGFRDHSLYTMSPPLPVAAGDG